MNLAQVVQYTPDVRRYLGLPVPAAPRQPDVYAVHAALACRVDALRLNRVADHHAPGPRDGLRRRGEGEQCKLQKRTVSDEHQV